MNINSSEVQDVNSLSIVEGLNLDRVKESLEKISDFQKVVQGTLVQGIDYGKSYLSASKPSLLKSGAEKILMLLGLTSEYEIIDKIQDFDKEFFAYTVRCILKRNNIVITQGVGHCNSKEKKYTSEKQDTCMLGNTCLKMAKKRAQVDAALTVGSLSNIFTQDLEDMADFDNKEHMETMTEGDSAKTVIYFGKYKGKTIGEIYEIDKKYIDWLSENANNKDIKKAAEIFLKQKESKPQQQKDSNNNVPPVDQDCDELSNLEQFAPTSEEEEERQF